MKRKLFAEQEIQTTKKNGKKETKIIFKDTPGKCFVCGRTVDLGNICELHRTIINGLFDGNTYEFIDIYREGPTDDFIDQMKYSEMIAIEEEYKQKEQKQ